MPLWQIYHPAGTFTDSPSKQSFAADITKMYVSIGLPAFYVIVNFIEMNPNDVYVGGKTKLPTEKPFVRVVITHIARHVPDIETAYIRTTSHLDQIMKPHLLDRGYDFEYHVDETDRRLWKINGLIPPPSNSEEEKIWGRENKAVVYDGAYPTSML
ncbi:hypothetical protein BO94DRAFT_536500 [Aspergillus sclerotioniger CBS 115572]|uniref:Tautomerase cis-CaaD-like domain-containing protein n=1 Tax=Aspergillus sclerotioniger CBS 115572 TaxID=1450535 RepID=A0A317WBH8_9EURO|nr:hypothetical protein BO94DRAFT_536500 [Aspergillus sclerotioniger CBS 115572]PWY83856.1 hypothetical protein BO94DRAFT_536500 [Aspergillus sclerotioniger CBS 115572]